VRWGYLAAITCIFRLESEDYLRATEDVDISQHYKCLQAEDSCGRMLGIIDGRVLFFVPRQYFGDGKKAVC